MNRLLQQAAAPPQPPLSTAGAVTPGFGYGRRPRRGSLAGAAVAGVKVTTAAASSVASVGVVEQEGRKFPFDLFLVMRGSAGGGSIVEVASLLLDGGAIVVLVWHEDEVDVDGEEVTGDADEETYQCCGSELWSLVSMRLWFLIGKGGLHMSTGAVEMSKLRLASDLPMSVITCEEEGVNQGRQ